MRGHLFNKRLNNAEPIAIARTKVPNYSKRCDNKKTKRCGNMIAIARTKVPNYSKRCGNMIAIARTKVPDYTKRYSNKNLIHLLKCSKNCGIITDVNPRGAEKAPTERRIILL